MTLESLILNIPFLIDTTIIAAYIIGICAVIFGTYDILHLKWTGDLKVMIIALLACSLILTICATLKDSSLVSNAMLATYFFITVAIIFCKQFSNNKLSHGPKPCKLRK